MTPFTDIYGSFFLKCADSDLANMSADLANDILEGYLTQSRLEFFKLSKIDISQIDSESKSFVSDLDDEIINILSTGMVWAWSSSKVNNAINLKNRLNTKDYSIFSPAQALKEFRALRDSTWTEFKRAIYAYTYRYGNIANPNE